MTEVLIGDGKPTTQSGQAGEFLPSDSPEHPQEERLSLLNSIVEQLKEEIGKPEISRIGLKNATPLSVTKWLRWFGEYKEPTDKSESPWRKYARLNLKGLLGEGKPEILNAIRFGHIIITSGNLPTDEVIGKKVIEVFIEDFPWDYQSVGKEGYDDGLKRVRETLNKRGLTMVVCKKDGDVMVQDESQIFPQRQPETQDNERENPSVVNPPVVINFSNVEINDEEKRKIIHQYLNISPFVIVIDRHQNYNTFHLIANHEYLDGVPTAYYLRKIVDGLSSQMGDIDEHKSLQMVEIGEVEENALKKILRRADLMEQHSDKKGKLIEDYAVKSVVLSPELVGSIFDLYSKVVESIGKDFELSFDTFFQMILFYFCGVDGLSVRGGALKFSFNALEQLGFHPVGDITKALTVLLSSSEADLKTELLKRLGFIVESEPGQKKLTLFLNGDLVREVIGRVAKLPVKLHKIANKISKAFKMALLLTGQVMTSNVPSAIRKINLGGIGGPAITEWQDAAFTFGIGKRIGFDDQGNFGYYDSQRNFHKLEKKDDGKWYEGESEFRLRIVVRRKYKKTRHN